jgi:UDP-GlcNAc:undecaprenyl-phosphate GlcNAc-1-phosphate transferase
MMMFWAALAAVVVSFGISVLATPISRRMAGRLGYIDLPHAHKAHLTPTPLLGGSAIFLAILLPSLLAIALATTWAAVGAPSFLPPQFARHLPGVAAKTPQALMILAAAMGMHVLGLVDDRKHLGPWSKLLVQALLIAGVVIFANLRILTVLDELTPLGALPSIVLSILWLLAITNAFNFLDNMDGLAVGVAAICAATLLGAAASIGQIFVSAWLCLILGALLGYLPYNFPPASTFMGDAGSLVIGFLLAAVSCMTTYVAPGTPATGAIGIHYQVLAPLVLMALPLYDTVSVILIRLRERRNPMVGDRRHFSHRLVARGMTPRSAVLTIYLCTGGTAIAAALLPRVDGVGAVLVLCQTVGILLIVALLEKGAPAGGSKDPS